LCVAFGSSAVFLLAKYGIKKKENIEYINSEKE